VEVGVWCAASARRIVGPVFFNEKINCVRYVHVIFGQFFSRVNRRTKTMAGFSKTQLLLTVHIYLCRLCPMSSGTELSAVVFGQHIHSFLILVIFSSGVV
jgi:hypothetical protein